MTNNGKAKSSHLDKLLDDKPPEFQAKVLRFAMDSGMSQQDPAFRLVQYIGYLAQLTETAPLEWQQLFKKLQSELDEWTQLTAEQLTYSADQSETINNLAQSCSRLSTALNALDLTSQQQLEQLKVLSEVSPTLRNVAQEIPTLKKLLVNLNQKLSSNQVLSVELNQSQMWELKREISTNSGNGESLLMNSQMKEILQNQKWLIQRQKESIRQKKNNNKFRPLQRIWEDCLNGVLDWVCRADFWLSSLGCLMFLMFFVFGSVFLIKLAFHGVPVQLDQYAQNKINKTSLQVENTYTHILHQVFLMEINYSVLSLKS
ncbi:MAG: DUF6753 family protein [Cyanobacteria bacterium P01_A01_bin.68]